MVKVFGMNAGHGHCFSFANKTEASKSRKREFVFSKLRDSAVLSSNLSKEPEKNLIVHDFMTTLWNSSHTILYYIYFKDVIYKNMFFA